MDSLLSVRPSGVQDINALSEIADATLFPGEMLPDMIAGYLNQTDEAVWLTALRGGAVVGFVFAEPEAMTDRVWNLKAIATHPDVRRLGVGRSLLTEFETAVQSQARMIVIDTSQLADQVAGRALYAACGYAQVASIPDFWEPGADKVTFSRVL